MIEWEYRKIALNDVPRKSSDVEVLDRAGEECWELVTVLPNNIAYLKRPLDDPTLDETRELASHAHNEDSGAPPTAPKTPNHFASSAEVLRRSELQATVDRRVGKPREIDGPVAHRQQKGRLAGKRAPLGIFLTGARKEPHASLERQGGKCPHDNLPTRSGHYLSIGSVNCSEQRQVEAQSQPIVTQRRTATKINQILPSQLPLPSRTGVMGGAFAALR